MSLLYTIYYKYKNIVDFTFKNEIQSYTKKTSGASTQKQFIFEN